MRRKLEQLIRQAETLLAESEGTATKWSRLALEDMIRQASMALDEAGVPFTRKREFFKPAQDEDCRFAAKRYTMAPSFLEPGKVYGTYGLEDAMEWFRQADLRSPMPASEIEEGRKGMLTEEEKQDFYIGQCRDFLGQVTYGNEIGQYDREAGKRLEAALAYWEQTKEEEGNDGERERREDEKTGRGDRRTRALKICLDCLQDLRFSRVLRSEREPSSCLLMTKEELEKVRRKIQNDPLTAGEYRKIKETADSVSLERRREAYEAQFQPEDYESWNQKFSIWGSTGNPPSFTAPEGSEEAVLRLRLPAQENEQEGLGHIWIDNLEIRSSLGVNLPIENGGFEICVSDGDEEVRTKRGEAQPEPVLSGWRPVILSGHPILRTEQNPAYCRGGKRSIYLCNPTAKDEGAWEHEARIPVRTDAMYTVSFDAKQDGKFKTGLELTLTFFNREGKETGTYRYVFNRKSWFDVKKYNLYAQCDAICYWYTGNRDYAEKAKIEMLHFMDDFLQGAEHWLIDNSRPEGSDAYGGVQGGRNLFALAFVWPLIRDSGVFSKEETERFYRMVDYFLRYLSDMRDRTTMSPERAQRYTSNWQTDMCIGTAAMMMALPDFPNRKVWLYNAEAVLRAQLDLRLNPDGSWPESIRYHHASLEHFALYAKMWLHESGENWFESTRLPEMFGYTLNTQTPPYAYFGGKIATPPFGDHKLGDGSEFAVYGLYCGLLARYDKAAADRMYETWRLAGRPVKGLWGECAALENLLYPAQGEYRTAPGFALELKSSRAFPDAGIYLFRKNYGQPEQNYLAVMASPKKIAHGHLDQGSFVLYHHSVPVIMDSGIEGYFDATTPWHISSYSHGVMQFETKRTQFEKQRGGFINLTAGTYSLERGWSDGPDHSRVRDVSTGGSREWIRIEIENPEGQGLQQRTILADHEDESYLVTDQVTGFDGRLLFNLPLLMKSARIDGNTVRALGYYGVNLDITFETPVLSLALDQGRATPMEPEAKGYSVLIYVRAQARAEDGFRVRIRPWCVFEHSFPQGDENREIG